MLLYCIRVNENRKISLELSDNTLQINSPIFDSGSSIETSSPSEIKIKRKHSKYFRKEPVHIKNDKPKEQTSKLKLISKRKKCENNDNEKKFMVLGQRYPIPPQDDGTRVFYESLLRQKPDCIMAKVWCLRHGMLPLDQAKKFMEDLKNGEKSASFVPVIA